MIQFFEHPNGKLHRIKNPTVEQAKNLKAAGFKNTAKVVLTGKISKGIGSKAI